jgi:hypothetical protein
MLKLSSPLAVPAAYTGEFLTGLGIGAYLGLLREFGISHQEELRRQLERIKSREIAAARDAEFQRAKEQASQNEARLQMQNALMRQGVWTGENPWDPAYVTLAQQNRSR